MDLVEQQDVYALVLRGRSLLAQGHPHQAVMFLERANELEPEKTSIREMLARALYLCGRKARAGEEFARVIELDPCNDYAHYGLGLCQAAAGNLQRARGLLKMALAMRPDSEDYQLALRRVAG
jgi:tetratricopeptide (TPR) repeat protein